MAKVNSIPDLDERKHLYPLVEKSLSEDGYTFEPQFPISRGRVDYLALKNNAYSLVEVKVSFHAGYEQTIAQLMRYAKRYSNPASLVVSAPGYSLTSESEKEYKNSGIHIYPIDVDLAAVGKSIELENLNATVNAAYMADLFRFSSYEKQDYLAYLQKQYFDDLIKWCVKWNPDPFELYGHMMRQMSHLGVSKSDIDKSLDLLINMQNNIHHITGQPLMSASAQAIQRAKQQKLIRGGQ